MYPEYEKKHFLGYDVIWKGRRTTVILDDGIEASVYCREEDEYDKDHGRKLAYRKARIKEHQNEFDKLCKEVVPSKKAKLLTQIKETEDKLAAMRKEVNTL